MSFRGHSSYYGRHGPSSINTEGERESDTCERKRGWCCWRERGGFSLYGLIGIYKPFTSKPCTKRY